MSPKAAKSSPPGFSRSVLAPVLLLFAIAGCNREEPIRSYSVPKTPSTARSAPVASEPARMLAAAVRREEQTWFFKLTGPLDAVAAQQVPFVSWLRSIRFEGPDDLPAWDLPASWSEEPGDGRMRFATVRIDGAEGLEATVIPLGNAPEMSAEEYELNNVNRWRNQLGLPPIDLATVQAAPTVEELGDEELVRVELPDGVLATLVNIAGMQSAAGSGMAPFAGGGRPAAAPPPQAAPFEYELPEGWQELPPDSMRVAAFAVTEADSTLEVTVIPLPPSDLLANVNRWCGQIGIPPLAADELDSVRRSIEIGGAGGDYVELWGAEDARPREAILGAIVTRAGQQWYFKLKGDAELAEREQQRFLDFLTSVQWPASDENDG